MKHMQHRARIVCGVAICGAALWSGGSMAASHREAPLIANDPTADNTDFYMFRSWKNPENVVFILNVIPVQEPSGGPNYSTSATTSCTGSMSIPTPTGRKTSRTKYASRPSCVAH